MKTMSIPEEECQYYDYPMAAALYKELGCSGDPRLGVLVYRQDDTEYNTVGWYSEEDDDTAMDLPIFKNFQMENEPEEVYFIPLPEREIFTIDNRLYIIIALDQGLGIRRVNLLFDESIVRSANALRGIPDIEYQLCKVYAKGYPKKFLDYCWVGRLDAEVPNDMPTMIIYPAFGSDETSSEEISGSLEAVPLREGETLYRKGTLWQLSLDKTYGASLVPLMELPFYAGFNDEKTLLN